MSDETDALLEADEPGLAVPVSCVQLNLLWQAFALKGCEEDQPKKSKMAKKFKALMVPAMMYVPKGDGDVIEKKDPRGGTSFPDGSQSLPMTAPQAEFLETLLKELKDKKNPDGSPLIDATVSDETEDLEQRAFPMWKAKVLPPDVPTGEKG